MWMRLRQRSYASVLPKDHCINWPERFVRLMSKEKARVVLAVRPQKIAHFLRRILEVEAALKPPAEEDEEEKKVKPKPAGKGPRMLIA